MPHPHDDSNSNSGSGSSTGGVFRDVSTIHTDARGKLAVLHFDHMPWTPQRSFMLLDSPAGATRGAHSHHCTGEGVRGEGGWECRVFCSPLH